MTYPRGAGRALLLPAQGAPVHSVSLPLFLPLMVVPRPPPPPLSSAPGVSLTAPWWPSGQAVPQPPNLPLPAAAMTGGPLLRGSRSSSAPHASPGAAGRWAQVPRMHRAASLRVLLGSDITSWKREAPVGRRPHRTSTGPALGGAHERRARPSRFLLPEAQLECLAPLQGFMLNKRSVPERTERTERPERTERTGHLSDLRGRAGSGSKNHCLNVACRARRLAEAP